MDACSLNASHALKPTGAEQTAQLRPLPQKYVATQAYKKADKKTGACVLREEGLPRHFSRVTVLEKTQASNSRSALTSQSS